MPEESGREPQVIERFAHDELKLTDSVVSVVAQAQAMVASAIGEAHDAKVRIEEFGATATTEEERSLATALAAANETIVDRLESIDSTLKAIRADSAASGKASFRFGWMAFVIATLIAIIGIVVGVVVSQ